MEKKWIIIPWISLCCLLLGMLRAFSAAFECPVSIKKHILPCILIAGCVLFCVVQLKKKYAVVCSLLGILGMAIYAAFRFDRLAKDFLSFVYYIDLKALEYNDTVIFGLDGIKGSMDNNMLLHFIGILSAVFISLTAFRLCKRFCGFLSVYAVLLLGLFVGRTPNIKSVSCLIVGMVLALIWTSRQEKGGKRWFEQKKTVHGKNYLVVYPVVAGVLILGILTAQSLSSRYEQKVDALNEPYLARQHNMEKKATEAMMNMVMYLRAVIPVESNGILSNTAPFYSEQVIMEITIHQKPAEDIYLRGFTGGSYENGTWTECDEKAFQELGLSDGDVTELWNVGYAGMRELNEWQENSSELWQENMKWIQYEITYAGTGKWTKYAYIPYYSNVESIEDEEGNLCAAIRGESVLLRSGNEYTVQAFNIDKNILQKYYTESYGEDDYTRYVQSEYTAFPNKLNKLRELVESYQIDKTWNALKKAQTVSKILSENAVYSKQLDAVPSDEDYTEYFLLKQKKGFCEHFATAGTLMLRQCGVPARYVSGYKVSADAFVQNKDGSYTAKVHDSDAHAWTEIYSGDIYGWIPQEMTPADGSSQTEMNTKTPEITARPEQKTEAAVPEVTKQAAVTNTPKAVSTPKVTATPYQGIEKTNKKAKGTDKGQENTTSKYSFIALVLMLSVMFALFCRTAYVRCHLAHYRKRYAEHMDDKNTLIEIRTAELLEFLHYCGMRGIDNQSEKEWCRELSRICRREFTIEEWEHLRRIIQKAEFADESVTQEEFTFFEQTVLHIKRSVYEKQGRLRKIYFRLIGVKR